jgi:surfeit locus 1 family protein
VTVFRKLVWPGLATLIALGILLSLGFWQLGRKAEKEAQFERLRMAVISPAKPLDSENLLAISVHSSGLPSIGYTEIAELSRVRLKGRFLPARSVPVRATLPATKGSAISGIGFFWMTPLEAENGQIVFVNRGFVSSGGDWKPPAIPTPEGVQEISGLMRRIETPGPFTPADNPGKGEYFSRDPAAMARAIGLDPAKVAPFFVDAERMPDNLIPPVGTDPREMIARIPNNHLQYAVTWFAFAATLIGVFGFFARARLKEPS